MWPVALLRDHSRGSGHHARRVTWTRDSPGGGAHLAEGEFPFRQRQSTFSMYLAAQ
jgi:hypothetical protein